MNSTVKNTPTVPTYLKQEYPYQATGTAISDNHLLDTSSVYEIRCGECKMSIRARGQKLRSTYERLQYTGCLSCGNRELQIRHVDMASNNP